MGNLGIYEIAYPNIKHPLCTENKILKEKYIQLLKYFIKDIEDECGYEKCRYRLNLLSKILLDKKADEIPPLLNVNLNSICKMINKIRFTPFHVFSYRYVLLFDVLFIVGVDNRELGNQIVNKILLMNKKNIRNSLTDFASDMYDGKFTQLENKLVTKEMLMAWMDSREYLSTRMKKITFTATMSAGKSTLINAVIGEDVSLSKKAACTSTIMKFRSTPCNTDDYIVLDGNGNILFMSKDEVKQYTSKLNQSSEIMGYFHSELSKRRVSIVDTPGVNSSLNPQHKKITRNELKTGTDILVYIIPVETYGSTDDYDHLQYIKNNVSYKKILFIINMMDSCDFEDDSVDEIVNDVKEHLSGIGFINPVVCPMSAKSGLLLKRFVLNEHVNDNDFRLCNLLKTKFNDENLQLGVYYPHVDSIQNVDASLSRSYIATGLPGFEKLLIQYLKED